MESMSMFKSDDDNITFAVLCFSHLNPREEEMTLKM